MEIVVKEPVGYLARVEDVDLRRLQFSVINVALDPTGDDVCLFNRKPQGLRQRGWPRGCRWVCAGTVAVGGFATDVQSTCHAAGG